MYLNVKNAEPTSLGWILMCSSFDKSDNLSQHMSLTLTSESHDTENLTDVLQKFWEVESVPASPENLMSLDDATCERHFSETHSRLISGKFSVRLPFKATDPTFPNSFSIAKQSLLRMEKRFVKNSDLESHYKSFFQEYLDLGHMRKLGDETNTSLLSACDSYYIPHHGIFQGDPKNLKFRIVFNASAKSSNRISLNDTLFAGPSLQSNIVDIMIRWRSYPYVYSADIQKMYRQIEIHPDDRNFQRILWRNSPDEPISIFELCTVTYGVAPSAYQALRCLRQLSIETRDKFSRVYSFPEKNMYVDDAFFGADTIDEAKSIASEFVDFLMAGGFPLRKWTANHADLLSDISDD